MEPSFKIIGNGEGVKNSLFVLFSFQAFQRGCKSFIRILYFGFRISSFDRMDSKISV